MNENDHCEITIEIFLKMTGHLPYDVFIELSPHKYTKIFKRNDLIDSGRLENYFQKGVKKLFILRKDRRSYIQCTERLIKRLMDQKSIDTVEASRAIEELSEQTLFEIFEDKIFDETTLKAAQGIAKTYVQWLNKDIGVLSKFLTLCRNETYIVRHSITTSVMAILLARADSNVTDKTLELVALGGLLHDIGMANLPAEINDVDRKLSPTEWEAVKSHPHLARDLFQNAKTFPSDLLQIIEQHHENYDGTGYPAGIKGESIFYPARIVAIADCFSALTTKRGGRSLFGPGDAISVLRTEGRKYDPKLLSVFETLLNPKRIKSA
jgi:putative nucleotidyltransferase with HDIG domain